MTTHAFCNISYYKLMPEMIINSTIDVYDAQKERTCIDK